MRRSLHAALALLAACAGSSIGAPVELMSPEAAPILRRVDRFIAAPDARPVCDRAVDVASFRDLCARVGGEVSSLGAEHVQFPAEQAVVLVLAGEPELDHVEITSEEGVDVMTLVVDTPETASGWQRTAFVLRLERRPCQLAVVVRDARAGGEHTFGVFDGL